MFSVLLKKNTMTKYFLSVLVMTTVSFVSFGQTTTPKLKEVKDDPKTTENAAKADAQLVNKKNVADSSVFKNFLIKRKDQRLKKRKSLQRRSS